MTWLQLYQLKRTLRLSLWLLPLLAIGVAIVVAPMIRWLDQEIFHAQTFMSVSEPLTDKEVSLLFPSGKQMQCWDSKLVYTYFRLTGDMLSCPLDWRGSSESLRYSR